HHAGGDHGADRSVARRHAQLCDLGRLARPGAVYSQPLGRFHQAARRAARQPALAQTAGAMGRGAGDLPLCGARVGVVRAAHTGPGALGLWAAGWPGRRALSAATGASVAQPQTASAQGFLLRVTIKALLLFVLVNLAFGLADPLPVLGRL